MSKKRGLINNVVILIISQILVKLLGLLYKLYLANKEGFGDAGNAIYNSGYQIYALLLTVSSIGVPNAVAKLVAENKEEANQILKSSLYVFSIIGVIFSTILVHYSKFISNNMLAIPEARNSLITLAPAIFNVCIISVFRGFYNGINKIDITAKSQTIEQLAKTILTVVLVEITYIGCFKNTEMMATFANFATTLATLVCVIYLYKKFEFRNTRARFSSKRIFEVIRISIPISMSAILASLNRNIDSVTIVKYLKKFLGENEAKVQYGILCGKIDVLASVPISFIIAITTTIIPNISGIACENKKMQRLIERYLKITLLLILPCSIGMIVFSKQILRLLYGNDAGYLSLIISSISLIFVSMEQVVHTILQAIGKIFVPAVALTFGVILKIILNIILLNISPNQYWYGGITGSVLATLCCHVLAFCISSSVMKKELKIKLKNFKFVLKPIFASCIMALCSYYAYFLLKRIIIENIAILLALVVAIAIYITSIFLFKILNDDELSSIPKIKMKN